MAGGRPRRVVVADDEEDVRQTIGEWLRQRGLAVTEAANGLEVLLHVKRQRPQLVVLDLFMPRLGGLDALRRIRAFDPTIRAVVVTGSSDPKLEEEALRLGAARVLRKPIQPEDLLAALDVGPPVVAPSGEAAPEGATAAGRGRVLVVDDDADFCETIEELLGSAGYSVRTVPTAASALFAVTQAVPDVILLDIAMPGLSGVDIIPALRFSTRDVKIIMVSGITDSAEAKRALAYGAFDYVTKPIDADYLLRAIEAALGPDRGAS